jgi:hypothetical protein
MRRPSVLAPLHSSSGSGSSSGGIAKRVPDTSGWVNHCEFHDPNAPRQPQQRYAALRISSPTQEGDDNTSVCNLYTFQNPDDYHRFFMSGSELDVSSMVCHHGAVRDIAQLHDLTHPVSGKKAIEIEFNNGKSWMLEAPTERDHQHWFENLRNAIQHAEEEQKSKKRETRQNREDGNTQNATEGAGVDDYFTSSNAMDNKQHNVTAHFSSGKQHGTFVASHIILLPSSRSETGKVSSQKGQDRVVQMDSMDSSGVNNNSDSDTQAAAAWTRTSTMKTNHGNASLAVGGDTNSVHNNVDTAVQNASVSN